MMDWGVIALPTGSVVLAILLVVELGDIGDPPAIMSASAAIETGPARVAQTPLEELIQTALARPLFSASTGPGNR